MPHDNLSRGATRLARRDGARYSRSRTVPVHPELDLTSPARGVRQALRLLAALAGVPTLAWAQTADSAAADEVRTESGIDPTRIVSLASVGFEVVDFPEDRFTSAVIPRFGVGAGHWSATIETRIAAVASGVPGEALVTGLGDAGLTVARAIGSGHRHSFALSAKLVVPVAREGIGGQAVTVTPSGTWVWTLHPTLVIAVQPQWVRSLLVASGAPEQSRLSLRGFVASFQPSGWFYVLEARMVEDFVRESTDGILSPAVGRNIGNRVTLAALLEVPVTGGGRDRYGTVARMGVQRVF